MAQWSEGIAGSGYQRKDVYDPCRLAIEERSESTTLADKNYHPRFYRPSESREGISKEELVRREGDRIAFGFDSDILSGTKQRSKRR